MNEKLKQFFCGITGHGSFRASVSNEKGGYGSHEYCPDCKKTLFLSVNEKLDEEAMAFLLRKL